MKKSVFFSLAILAVAAIMLMSFSISQQQPKAWPVPAEFKNMKNPAKADAESLQIGKMAYNKNCASCHGKLGLGDGPKARTLETPSGDFSAAYYQNQTDGEHFYKTKTGREDMPAYDKKIADEDIWHIVNYMRTFKK
jgi:mono/diheme cytochrome c family protein